jgi:DNA-binding MarR family transcriptional regulator
LPAAVARAASTKIRRMSRAAIERQTIAIDNISTSDIMRRMAKNTLPDPESLLPLPPATFHILMALAAGDRHGYAIMQAAGLSAGTLYRSLQRMLEQGLIVETADDERRRYYRITDYGESVARAEARRLREMVRLARASGFVRGRA